MNALIVLVGHNGSGKTTLSKKLEKDLGINVVSGDPLRLLIKQEVRYFSDFDISIPTEKGKKTNSIIVNYRAGISRLLLSEGQTVIYDSNALRRSDRKQIFTDVSEGLDATRIILWSKLPESELLERLRVRPEKNWVDHYKLHKKHIFEAPEASEADYLLEYNQNNYDEILQGLKEIID